MKAAVLHNLREAGKMNRERIILMLHISGKIRASMSLSSIRNHHQSSDSRDANSFRPLLCSVKYNSTFIKHSECI